MWKEKPTGVKILWVWTLGTAAVLVIGVTRTRLRDMDKLINQPQQQQNGISTVDSVVLDSSSSSSPSDEFVREDKL